MSSIHSNSFPINFNTQRIFFPFCFGINCSYLLLSFCLRNQLTSSTMSPSISSATPRPMLLASSQIFIGEFALTVHRPLAGSPSYFSFFHISVIHSLISSLAFSFHPIFWFANTRWMYAQETLYHPLTGKCPNHDPIFWWICLFVILCSPGSSIVPYLIYFNWQSTCNPSTLTVDLLSTSFVFWHL